MAGAVWYSRWDTLEEVVWVATVVSQVGRGWGGVLLPLEGQELKPGGDGVVGDEEVKEGVVARVLDILTHACEYGIGIEGWCDRQCDGQCAPVVSKWAPV